MGQKGRYPLSTADGQSIPFEVKRPFKQLRILAQGALSNSGILLPEETEVIEVYASHDCVLVFANSNAPNPAIPASGYLDDSIFIPANLANGIPSVISPILGKRYVTATALSTNGSVFLNCVEVWTGLVLSTQSDRR